VGHEAYKILGPTSRKKKYKIRYKGKYLFRMRKEITTNYKFKKADKYHKHHKIQKNNTLVIFLLIICLTHLYNT
jgi:hypothetical protein